MVKFDLISDVHLDFWVEHSGNLTKMNRQLDAFIQLLLPASPSSTLVIAGDLGHFNKQNAMMLTRLKEHYPHIVIAAGNHDYYLVSKSIKNKYKKNSFHRWAEMKRLLEPLPDVHILDGNSIEIDGIRFGGCGMWYDFQYGLQVLKADEDQIYAHWKTISNDSALIEGRPRLVNWMFQEENRKLHQVLPDSDVIVTHVSPDWTHVPADRADQLATSFYYFDGSEYFGHIHHKIWCFGHVHSRMDYTSHGCRFINASLGYPDKNNGVPQPIVTIQHKP
ncbi:metallophosphoesterase family protein [Paenibacillus oleatilyticus]|uniref:metallophosphoesterase family protein n=1 Tax=Paenibacillus oleatilyticus TaxID=2594886 RepID=UPI001C1F7064|nr:metallophosphoesterase [Paenibacillus oleatilyticus]MBU7315643.1 metallophosphoesterase [Paenibacillus oleatilyticus]